MKAKRTLAALTKPPKSLLKGNYERIIEKSFIKAERLGSIVSHQRLAERRAGKKIAQLGEQANQSFPLLQMSSDIVTNHPGILPGTNLADYMHDNDAYYDIMEVDEFRY